MGDVPPLVSVLVLNFNGASHLDACLGSLRAQTYQPLEVVVADNGSNDNSVDVAARYPVRWVPLTANHGFAKGNNLGAARCRGEVLVFVNNDMRFANSFVDELVRPLASAEGVFATDARQMNWVNSREVHLATRLIRRDLLGILRRRGLMPLLDIVQEAALQVVPVFQACAANMAVRRTMFEALGGFDERLAAGWEDTEICWRAWLRGWATLYLPNAVCWHKVSASSKVGDGREMRFRGALGGRLLFATKHLPWEHVLASWSWSFLGTLSTVSRGSLGEGIQRMKILLQQASLVPMLLRERHRLYREAGVSPREHLRAMLGFGVST